MPSEWERIVSQRAIQRVKTTFKVEEGSDFASAELDLRTEDEIFHRIIALWIVSGFCQTDHSPYFAEYVELHKLDGWLTKNEKAYLDHPTDYLDVQYSWCSEALYFLCWACNLTPPLHIPTKQCKFGPILDLFPQELEAPDRLRAAISLRPNEDIACWEEILHRLAWAARANKLGWSRINAGVVQEWNDAVTWLTKADEEHPWLDPLLEEPSDG